MNAIRQTPQLTEEVYVELVCSLFATLLPTLIMTTSFMIVGVWIVSERPDTPLFVLFMLTAIATLWRIGLLLAYRDQAQAPALTPVRAGQLERRFALAYYAFALCFGLFAARAFVVGANEHRLLIVGLVFGYGAGVAAGISLRPWIGIPSALMAVMPMVAASFFVPARWSTGLLTALFLVAGIESMLRRFQATSRQLMTHRLLSTIERRDELTGLPNRVMLRERFNEMIASKPGAEMIAIHSLVLSRIDDVNANHGYPAGDAILKAAAERIGRLTDGRALPARLSGVEFAIVQPDLLHPRHAEMLAREIVAALTRGYLIDDGEVFISAHVGFTLDVQQGADLNRLLNRAGEAAHRARHEQLDVMAHEGAGWAPGRSRLGAARTARL